MDFDLVDIKLFVNVATAKGLARGAKRSFLSVPSASIRLRNLEEKVGTVLLSRNPHGVELTPAGKTFLDHGRRVLEELQKLSGDLQEYSRGMRGHIRVLAPGTATEIFLPNVVRAFLASRPGISVELREDLSADIVRLLLEGNTDIGIVASAVNTKTLESRPYRDYRFVLATAPNHPLAQRDAVAFEETLEFDHVCRTQKGVGHRFLLEAASALNRTLETRVHVESYREQCRMVECGLGIAVLPEPFVTAYANSLNISIIPLVDHWAIRQLYICAQNFDGLTSFARELVKMLLADAAGALPAASLAITPNLSGFSDERS